MEKRGLTMRKTILLNAFGAVAFSDAAAQAATASLLCDATKTTDCFKEEVFILRSDPDGLAPLVKCEKDGKVDPAACVMDHAKVVDRYLEILKTAGVTVPDTQWDQLVVYGAD